MEPNNYLELQKSAKELAVLLWEYYNSLIEAGFDEVQAIHLTGEFQRAIFQNKGQ